GGQWLRIGKVIDNGETSETYNNGGTQRRAGWDGLRDPRGGTFAMDEATAKRAASWPSLDGVWMFGCFKHDWADMSTPVKSIDKAAGTVTAAYASYYGYEPGKTYYFYNILEELDEPGEWYLDRDAGLLYLWPPEGDFADARLDLSLSTETLISGKGLKNVTFTGLTLQGTRGNGMALTGDGVTVDHCVIRCVAGDALSLDGYRNTASDNEIYGVGGGGVYLGGGDAATLTPGESKAVNNLVHDWAQVSMTYHAGICLTGTGNLVAHNELYNSPHAAIIFGGNNQVIEYNLLHHVCLLTHDAGAMYAGRSLFNSQGTVVRSNVIYDLGGLASNNSFRPCGIYLDDGLSGVAVLNNLLVNVPGTAIAVSGRDLDIHGNVTVNAGTPVGYDNRTRGGALAKNPDFWFYAHTGPGGGMWRDLEASPWQTETWKAAYPKLAALSTDFADIESPSFAANPAGSSVTGNVYVGPNKPNYDKDVLRFSTVGPNGEYRITQLGTLFADASKGDYTVRPGSRIYKDFPAWENIPLEQIGRIG
ncbi:MAG: right-handed parallel beta-helix repeat-containing protein, partial [Oscillospiraceae bacterium]|nr:right-handed parallel beta-helix repeat-containing protein [Oscillospiraceae bacterium]